MNRESRVHWRFTPELGVVIDPHDRHLRRLSFRLQMVTAVLGLRGASFGHMNRFE